LGFLAQAPALNYFPYGEIMNPQSGNGDGEAFGTYSHNNTTGLDYADQRYYASQYGRFMSADPYKRSAKLFDSGSWNRYAYVRNNPVNSTDSSGLFEEDPCWDNAWCGDDDPGGQGGGRGDRSIHSVTDKYGALTLLDIAISKLGSGCEKAFTGKTGDAAVKTLTDAAQNLTFYDGRTDTGTLGLAGAKDGTTFAQYHSQHLSTFATTLLDKNNHPSYTVVLWADFFGNVAQGFPTSPEEQEQTLWHELAHAYSGLDDQAAVEKFKINTNGFSSYSAAFDNWLKKDCPKP
jgi:RHS repeat-associated protein